MSFLTSPPHDDQHYLRKAQYVLKKGKIRDPIIFRSCVWVKGFELGMVDRFGGTYSSRAVRSSRSGWWYFPRCAFIATTTASYEWRQPARARPKAKPCMKERPAMLFPRQSDPSVTPVRKAWLFPDPHAPRYHGRLSCSSGCIFNSAAITAVTCFLAAARIAQLRCLAASGL